MRTSGSSLTMPRLVIFSDTHGLHDQVEVPAGDILIHAGDVTNRGTLAQVSAFDDFLASLPHEHKIVIAGNHDFCFEEDPAPARARLRHATYVQDYAVEKMGLRCYGSPWQPAFFDWAFNLPRGEALREKWSRIPDDLDVLITHGPPHGILDRTHDNRDVGCEELRARVTTIKPRLHCFGHIHEAPGVRVEDDTLFINATTGDLAYRPVNPPIVVDIERGETPRVLPIG